jgi:metal-dependent amidase/aminoacylase/carboxypeptidase family protein
VTGLSLAPMDPKERVRRRIDTEASSLIRLSHTIHGHPELAYEEVRSSALLAGALEEAGLDVERSCYGLETAFRAMAGHEGLHIVICAEYDALPGIGHACGHNIIGASSVGAGLALSEVAEDVGIRVTILGTPAEERGGGLEAADNPLLQQLQLLGVRRSDEVGSRGQLRDDVRGVASVRDDAVDALGLADVLAQAAMAT